MSQYSTRRFHSHSTHCGVVAADVEVVTGDLKQRREGLRVIVERLLDSLVVETQRVGEPLGEKRLLGILVELRQRR